MSTIIYLVEEHGLKGIAGTKREWQLVGKSRMRASQFISTTGGSRLASIKPPLTGSLCLICVDNSAAFVRIDTVLTWSNKTPIFARYIRESNKHGKAGSMFVPLLNSSEALIIQFSLTPEFTRSNIVKFLELNLSGYQPVPKVPDISRVNAKRMTNKEEHAEIPRNILEWRVTSTLP
ncbi:hypothetical protein CPB86DRAFT_801191 [Serendipita vermifera]|nr:hypothetical protein CPB86DRAFT_801191 [Serendipita vermifera]